MNIKLVTLSNLIKFKELLMGIINTKVSELTTEFTTRLATKSDTGHRHDNATTSKDGFMSASDKVKLNELTELTTEFSTELATKSDAEHRHDNATTSKDGFMSASDKVKLDELINYTAGEGIKIENGVISFIEKIKVGYPTCPGYTLYGDYFLSNTITANKTWNEACAMVENVIVKQNYNYGNAEMKVITARTLTKDELETLTTEQRKNSGAISSYWTSTPYVNNDGDGAWYVNIFGSFYNGSGGLGDGGARLGFRNPFV